MLDVRDLAFGIGARRIGAGVSFTLAPGETLAVLGGNGAGKTTLFRTLLGLLPVQGGMLAIDGEEVARLAPAKRARKLAYVPQQHSSAFGFSVLEAVLMGRAARIGVFARPGRGDYDVAYAALDTLGIGTLATRAINEVSGGERQLVMIARALAQAAPVLVLDEPTTSLDFGNRLRVLAEVDRLRARGMTILFSTHEPDQALAHADRALLLFDGRMLAFDSVERALTPENIERLYGTKVQLVKIDERSYACVPRC
ncbi:MAG TPA: ABC transporter ATP-binding protein [Casimicrobiaceae bacterium]|nr:ABC transporter ATP-binding protein [Casimicrobiaceae bacterium]